MNDSKSNGTILFWKDNLNYYNGIHGVTLSCISLSLIGSFASIGSSIYNNNKTSKSKSFYKWLMNERLIVYLSIIDLLYCTSAITQEVFLLFRRYPPHWLCQMCAFGTLQLTLSQMLLVLYIAINSFKMVVKTSKLHLGKADWRLILFVLTPPAVIATTFGALKFLGPNGAW